MVAVATHEEGRDNQKYIPSFLDCQEGRWYNTWDAGESGTLREVLGTRVGVVDLFSTQEADSVSANDEMLWDSVGE